MNRIFRFIFLILTLTSCNSFNSTVINLSSQSTISQKTDTIRQELSPAISITPTPIIPPTAIPSKAIDTNLCPIASLPDPVKIPGLPVDEIQRMAHADTDKVDAVIVKHIEELRKTLIQLNTEVARSKAAYIAGCKKYHNSK